jgi:capsular exopolysaccharide synthesis family protein
MRNPRIHSLFNLPNSTGLSNYLAGNTEEEIIIRQIPDEPISLITSGPAPPNPAELLQSNRMRLLMKRMMAAYDYVLIDSPPVQRVTDSLPLSTFVDGVILITRSGTTTYDTLKSGLKKLANVHAPILGIIVNGLIKKRDSGHYGYHEYYNKE